jgi:hypothetical protein
VDINHKVARDLENLFRDAIFTAHLALAPTVTSPCTRSNVLSRTVGGSEIHTPRLEMKTGHISLIGARAICECDRPDAVSLESLYRIRHTYGEGDDLHMR